MNFDAPPLTSVSYSSDRRLNMSQNARVEDDDLDDLDDVLDQFSASAKPISPPQPSTSAGASTSTSAHPAADPDEALTEDFAAELAKGMESLFKDLGIEPGASTEGLDGVAERERLAAAWEAMLVEGMDSVSDLPGVRAPADASSSKPNFQSHIRSTMNKLKETESSLKSSDSTTHGDGESIESLLQGLSDLSGDGERSEEEIQGILEAMMGQLMSKDVLYEPLKELHEKFPDYLAKHDSALSPEDRKRFEAQISCIERLLTEFEAKTYHDEDEKTREKIVQLMSELQAHGSPPEEIMGPLPPGLSMAADGLPDCNVG